MSKRLLLLIPVSVALVLALIVAGGALAQGTTPTTPAQPAQPGQQQTQPNQGKGLLGGLGHCFGFDFGFGGGKNNWAVYDAVAAALKLTPDQLFTRLHNGETIQQIAQAQGVNMTDVQNAAQAAGQQAMKDAINQAVKDGKITQDQANWLLQGLQNGYIGRGMRGFGGFGGRFGGMPGRPGKVAPANPTTPSTPHQGGTGNGTGFRHNGQAPRITMGQTF